MMRTDSELQRRDAQQLEDRSCDAKARSSVLIQSSHVLRDGESASDKVDPGVKKNNFMATQKQSADGESSYQEALSYE